jgi:hypothetical protein
MFKSLETVALTRDLPEQGLKAGDVGAIVHVYADGKTYEVEFVSLKGETLAIVTLELGDLRAIAQREIANVGRVA